MADCTRFDCTDYDPCPDCLTEARGAGLFPASEEPPVGPHCGNNPTFRLSPGDRQAVEAFKAYLARRAAGGPPERDPFTGPQWETCDPKAEGIERDIQREAVAPFVPPAHYIRDDGVECCVHTIPIGPDSCAACRELADD